VEEDRLTASAGDDRVIVLVPGLWNRGIEFLWLRRLLGRAAARPTFLFRYRTVADTFEESVTRLTDFVESLPATPVDLVGHSLGGLLTLAALARLPADGVGRVVLLGPPVNGSRAVRSALARIPGSRRIIGRNAPVLAAGVGHPPAGIEIGVIAGSGGLGVGRVVTRFDGPNDGTVAVAETRLSGARDALVLPVTHTGMLFSKEVAAQAAHFLDHGSFDRHGAATESPRPNRGDGAGGPRAASGSAPQSSSRDLSS
jgi:pimeloyl-ACP methyl ester carboxylesterase